MNTALVPSKEVQPVNFTNSVLTRQENLRRELLSGLNQDIVGQDEAKEAIVTVLLNGLFNVYREQGALGAVFLGGPTGVGKTELARSLARMLLGDPNSILKIPGEGMAHPVDIGKLTGSGAGFVGYGDTPLMSDIRVHAGYRSAKEKRMLHPIVSGYEAGNFSIVLVDEIEKAHPDIPNAFLNAMQSWEMEMSSGKEGSNSVLSKNIDHSRITDLSNTLFIFTSNIGEHSISKGKTSGIGFTKSSAGSDQDDSVFKQALKKHFAPEFLGRMDAVVRCHSLTEEQIRHIFSLNITKMNRVLGEKKYFSSLKVATSPEFVDHSLGQSKWTEYGARAIAGIMKNLGAQVGMVIQSGRLPREASGVIEFDVSDGKPTIEFFHETPTERSMHERDSAAVSSEDLRKQVRALVESKIYRYTEQVRETVQAYLELISSNDPGFRKACAILERRLRGYGLGSEDILALQTSAFMDVYETIDYPKEYEIIVRNDTLFGPVGFRAIEKFLRSAIVRWFSLEKIYQYIKVLLKRPMVRDEAIVISQHIHRLLQTRIVYR